MIHKRDIVKHDRQFWRVFWVGPCKRNHGRTRVGIEMEIQDGYIRQGNDIDRPRAYVGRFVDSLQVEVVASPKRAKAVVEARAAARKERFDDEGVPHEAYAFEERAMYGDDF